MQTVRYKWHVYEVNGICSRIDRIEFMCAGDAVYCERAHVLWMFVKCCDCDRHITEIKCTTVQISAQGNLMWPRWIGSRFTHNRSIEIHHIYTIWSFFYIFLPFSLLLLPSVVEVSMNIFVRKFTNYTFHEFQFRFQSMLASQKMLCVHVSQVICCFISIFHTFCSLGCPVVMANAIANSRSQKQSIERKIQFQATACVQNI